MNHQTLRDWILITAMGLGSIGSRATAGSPDPLDARQPDFLPKVIRVNGEILKRKDLPGK